VLGGLFTLIFIPSRCQMVLLGIRTHCLKRAVSLAPIFRVSVKSLAPLFGGCSNVFASVGNCVEPSDRAPLELRSYCPTREERKISIPSALTCIVSELLHLGCSALYKPWSSASFTATYPGTKQSILRLPSLVDLPSVSDGKQR
jgi:hypothetical protein